MNLTLAAIRRPTWVFMLVVAALVMGWRALSSLPVEENPDVTFPNVVVSTVYFGASPDEIETQISKKIEDAITSIEGIQSINSTSNEGVSIVNLEFELSVNQDTALADVKSKVDAIVDSLPRDAEKPVIQKVNFASQPILFLAAESDRMSPMELRDFLDDRVKDRLSRIAGVAEVGISGASKREIRVGVDKNRLISYGLGITDVLNAVRTATVNVPGGRISQGDSETSVRVKGEFKSVDELRSLVIPISNKQDPNGAPAIVRLQDIAEIIDGPAERTAVSRVNGRESVLVTVQKTREGNTVAIDEAVRAELAKISQEHGVKFTTTFEGAKGVKESIEDLNIALFLGIFLVIGIIYLFLHNFRGTMIVALAIPTCLFVAFAAIQAFGFTLNTMTMLGLSLAVGILVDDAIVVLENTYRHLTMGEEPETAALNGRAEIGLAAIAITMVDLVVFLPVAFMGGIIGQFFRPFALTVAAATLTSLFVSFTLTPMLASRWYRKGENLEDKRGFAKWFDERFHAFANGYRNLLDQSLRRRWVVFIGGWAFLFGIFMMIGAGMEGGNPDAKLQTALAGPMMMAMMALGMSVVIMVLSFVFRRGNLRIPLFGLGFGIVIVLFAVLGFALGQNKKAPLFTERFFGGGDEGRVSIRVTMPAGTSLDKTTSVVERVEQVAMKLPETEYVTSQVGSQQGGFGAGNTGSQYAEITVTLFDKKAIIDSVMFWQEHGKMRDRGVESIVSDLQRQIGKVPDAKVIVSSAGAFGGAPIDVRILSTRPDEVAPAAAKALKVIAGVNGVVSAELSSKPGKPELIVRPDRTRMADSDITVADLGAATRVLYEGDASAKYREGGREYDIRVNLADDVKQNPAELSSVPIAFRDGNAIHLGDVADIDPGVGPDKVERRDRQRQIAVTAQLLPGFVPGTVGQEITKQLTAANLGESVTFSQGGENEVQAREMPYMAAAFGLGIILVFLVLASLFDNLLYPFVIQLAQPQALAGALMGLMVANKPSDVVVMIGIIMLIGLVGKNAILLVDYTNTLRGRGLNRHDALVEAGPTRLRPIMMTTMAMILSMLPVALAIGRGSEFRAPLGIVIIGGLTLSTILTLFIIPSTYTLFDDLSLSIGKLFKRKRGDQPQTPAEPATAMPE